jgi:hypothetical protein
MIFSKNTLTGLAIALMKSPSSGQISLILQQCRKVIQRSQRIWVVTTEESLSHRQNLSVYLHCLSAELPKIFGICLAEPFASLIKSQP